jgi:DNA polymerase-3 subunit beta
VLSAVRDDLRHALQRTAILSNEKYRGIRFVLKPNALVIQSHNPEQEEAEEELEVGYAGDELEIGFNVNYLLDALAAIDGQDVQVGLSDGNSSCLIRAAADTSACFVVMPMRL